MSVRSVIERIGRDMEEGELSGLFFDFDGTISEIVETPDKARILPGARECLKRMAGRGDIVAGVISGRSIDDLKERVGVQGLVYSGNHGAELEIFGERQVLAESGSRPLLGSIARELCGLGHVFPGLLVEDKGYSVSVHTRRVAGTQREDVKNRVKESAGRFPNLTVREGKRVFEILPVRSANKGDVLRVIISRIEENRSAGVFPVYFGDDVTDRYVYEYLREREKGLFIFVSGKDRVHLEADFELEGPGEVVVFMIDFLTLGDTRRER